tara:strand:+ start:44 stop:1690 length:1647 start_codon:yes stop_codon:yes gene_type:complete
MSKICIGQLEHGLSQVHVSFKNSGSPINKKPKTEDNEKPEHTSDLHAVKSMVARFLGGKDLGEMRQVSKDKLVSGENVQTGQLKDYLEKKVKNIDDRFDKHYYYENVGSRKVGSSDTMIDDDDDDDDDDFDDILEFNYENIKLKIKNMVEKGADPNVIFETKWRGNEEFQMTPLMFAVRVGEEELIKFLIAKGANVNLKTKNVYDTTPEHKEYVHKVVGLSKRELAGSIVSRDKNRNNQNELDKNYLVYFCMYDRVRDEFLDGEGSKRYIRLNNNAAVLYKKEPSEVYKLIQEELEITEDFIEDATRQIHPNIEIFKDLLKRLLYRKVRLNGLFTLTLNTIMVYDQNVFDKSKKTRSFLSAPYGRLEGVIFKFPAMHEGFIQNYRDEIVILFWNALDELNYDYMEETDLPYTVAWLCPTKPVVKWVLEKDHGFFFKSGASVTNHIVKKEQLDVFAKCQTLTKFLDSLFKILKDISVKTSDNESDIKSEIRGILTREDEEGRDTIHNFKIAHSIEAVAAEYGGEDKLFEELEKLKTKIYEVSNLEVSFG